MTQDSASNGLVNPFNLKSEAGYTWFRGNLHCHTTNSDGQPSPQERLDGYVNQGYDFLCLSDHYTISRIERVKAPDPFVLIQGAELHPHNPFGGQTHHFLCLNIHEDMDSVKMPPQHVIDEVNRQGGSAWLAHPHWSSVSIARDTLPLSGLAGVEVFNTTCRCAGRGESAVHWDDWMEQQNRIYPALANDDAHALESENKDTYQGWTMVRAKERTAETIMEALNTGAGYCSTGPQIHDIQIRWIDRPRNEDEEPYVPFLEAAVHCSEARRVVAVCNQFGTEYHENGTSFEHATLTLARDRRWVRFEVIAPDGAKAWSNPFDLTVIERV